MSISFFDLCFKVGHGHFRTRAIDAFDPLIAEATPHQYIPIGGKAAIGDTLPDLEAMAHVIQCPELPVRASHLVAKQLRRAITV